MSVSTVVRHLQRREARLWTYWQQLACRAYPRLVCRKNEVARHGR